MQNAKKPMFQWLFSIYQQEHEVTFRWCLVVSKFQFCLFEMILTPKKLRKMIRIWLAHMVFWMCGLTTNLDIGWTGEQWKNTGWLHYIDACICNCILFTQRRESVQLESLALRRNFKRKRLDCIGDDKLPSYIGIILISHEIRIPSFTNQDFNGK